MTKSTAESGGWRRALRPSARIAALRRWAWSAARWFALVAAVGALPGAAQEDSGRTETTEDAVDVVGRPAGEWTVDSWMNVPDPPNGPSLADLRGEVVLVRWFTLTECPFCSASAPALNEFHEVYGARGLRVIGFYHHKGRAPLRMGEVRSAVREYGFRFPVAVDSDWRTLRRWWLDARERAWTSVSFLIDRKGVVRHVHPGGKYVKGDEDYGRLRAMIETLVAEKAEKSEKIEKAGEPGERAPDGDAD